MLYKSLKLVFIWAIEIIRVPSVQSFKNHSKLSKSSSKIHPVLFLGKSWTTRCVLVKINLGYLSIYSQNHLYPRNQTSSTWLSNSLEIHHLHQEVKSFVCESSFSEHFIHDHQRQVFINYFKLFCDVIVFLCDSITLNIVGD